MRKIVLLLLFLYPSFFLAAQQKIIITGKVSSPTSNMIAIALNPNPISPVEDLRQTEIKKDNTFRFELESDKPIVADLVYDENLATLFLQPGDELHITFKASSFVKSLKFKGKGSNENNYLSKFSYTFDENDYYQMLPENIYFREEGINKFLTYRKEDQLKFYEKFIKKNPVSEAFKNYALAEIEYTYANDKLTYQNLREYIVLSEPRLQLSPAFYDFLNTTKIDNPDALQSPAYRSFTRLYLEHLTDIENLKKTDPQYYIRSYELAKKVYTGNVRDLILARIINESLRNGPLNYSEQMLADYKSLNPGKEFTQFLDGIYKEFKNFAIGSNAPDFSLKDLNGNTVKLSDFTGRVVYLVFWSTKCGLCMIDLPYIKYNHEKLKDENVVFLYVAVDEDETSWREMVLKKKLEGVHVFAPKSETSVLADFQVPDVPAYFIIGKDGAFINRKPKRPSHNDAAAEIQAAINN